MPRHSTRLSSQVDHDRIVIESDDERDDGRRTRHENRSSQPDGGFAALPEEQQDELTQRFIRFMLCRNSRKRPVRRTDLTKHLFRNMENIRSKQNVFRGVMTRAKMNLRKVYGMEVVQLKRNARRMATQRSTMLGSASQASGTSSAVTAYILMSTLPLDMRVEDRERLAEIGFLTVVAAMILLTPGCRILEKSLYRSLERVGVFVKDSSGHKQINAGNVKELLEKEWPEQWYLDREKEDNDYFFTLGPRLRAEVDDEHLIDFIDAVYSIPGDQTSSLDETAREELKQRLQEAQCVEDDAEDGDA